MPTRFASQSAEGPPGIPIRVFPGQSNLERAGQAALVIAAGARPGPNRPWSCGSEIPLLRWLSPVTEDRGPRRMHRSRQHSVRAAGLLTTARTPQASERLQGFLFLLANLEEAVELGDLEHFVNLLGDVTEH